MLSKQSFFPCPNCGETIGSDKAICRYCKSPIDPAAATAAIDLQQRINQACNDASMARNMAAFMWLAVVIQIIYAVAGRLLFFGLMLGLPFMLFRWWGKYGRIKTSDVDFASARRNWKIALLLWAPTPLVLAVLAILAARS